MCSVPTTDAIAQASLAVRRERRELTDERQAFEAFHDRIADLDPEQPQRGQTTVMMTTTPGLETVRDAYAETVMNVPHYTEVYDESFTEHIAGELGVELATAITTGSWLHPELQRRLLEAADQAIVSREYVLEHLTTEADALERAEADLEAVIEELETLLDQPLDVLEFNVLRLTRARLDGLRETCDEIGHTRQEELRRRQRVTAVDGDDLGELLYEDEAGLYPVLATIAEIGEAIDRAKRRIDRRLTTVR